MTALRNLLRRLLSLPDGSVRPADKPAPTGDAPFLSVKLVSSPALGAERRDFDGEKEQETITSSYLSKISVNAFGTNAYDLMLKARSVLASSAGISGFRAMGAGLVSVSDVLDLSAIVGAGYEARARIELQVSHIHRVVTDLKRFDSVHIDAYTSAGQHASADITPTENP